MSTYMTRVEFTDVHAETYADDGVGAWSPLNAEQRRGDSCIDCGSLVIGSTARRVIGTTDEGPARVCLSCYIQRLKDNIDYYRPQS